MMQQLTNTQKQIPGQLTSFPVGSICEIWTLSYPLMISLFSVGIMIFCDRLFLASISVEVFNGVSEAAMFFMAFEFSIVTLAAVSEVLVGRYFGARQFDRVAAPVWAMIWMSIASAAIFYPFALFGGDLVFYGSPYAAIAKQFFCTLCFFGPLLPLNAALSSFWIGRGRVVFVTSVVAISSCLNIILDYLMIFGRGPFPELGVYGAALGTGISQLFLSIVLFTAFLRRKYRKRYNTAHICFDFVACKEALFLGFPQALAMGIQCLAWAFFFRIMSITSEQHAFICAIAQAIFFFFNFIIEGISKAVAAISSNLIGAKRFIDIKLVVSAGIKLLFMIGALLCACIISFPEVFLELFLPDKGDFSQELFENMYSALFWIWLSLMGEAMVFLFGGVLLAFGDSRFILLITSVCVWVFGVAPAAVATLILHQGPAVALALATCYYAIAGVAFWFRIRSWLGLRSTVLGGNI